jgi:dipeptidase E
MILDLFCLPGPEPIQNIVNAAKRYLLSLENARVAYIPAANDLKKNEYMELTRRGFADLAHVDLIHHNPKQSECSIDLLSDTSLVYIPGGNTYLLAKRLKDSGLWEELSSQISRGIPFVGFSAGTILVGESMSMSNDDNAVGLDDPSGLGLVPFTFAVHYSVDQPDGQEQFLDRVQRYQASGGAPVIAMEDDAHLRVEGGQLMVIRGISHLFKSGQSPRLLRQGVQLTAA